ncbi:hypothetical protein CDL12_26372 [Handroanthus impetiginosus]|uniref:Aminotransferase-like plant mobile domain-containing protein n=1 Tax=Handroanthus impetiginosus TaxID=429701 RepID=A0A2G9G7H9_9LAMI|nr:hypothetical protein CDL12_26372 [Handroanthus impetiginosus]
MAGESGQKRKVHPDTHVKESASKSHNSSRWNAPPLPESVTRSSIFTMASPNLGKTIGGHKTESKLRFGATTLRESKNLFSMMHATEMKNDVKSSDRDGFEDEEPCHDDYDDFTSSKVRQLDHRTSLPKLLEINAGLTTYQKIVVKKMGFESILKLKIKNMDKVLINQLAECVDPIKRVMKIQGYEVKITAGMVRKCLGIPSSGRHMPKIGGQGDIKYRHLFEGANPIKEVGDLTTYLKACPTDGVEFIVPYMMLLFSTMFFPGSGNKLNFEQLDLIVDIDNLDKYNWAECLIESLMDGIYRRKFKKQTYVTGCVFLLEISLVCILIERHPKWSKYVNSDQPYIEQLSQGQTQEIIREFMSKGGVWNPKIWDGYNVTSCANGVSPSILQSRIHEISDSEFQQQGDTKTSEESLKFHDSGLNIQPRRHNTFMSEQFSMLNERLTFVETEMSHMVDVPTENCNGALFSEMKLLVSEIKKIMRELPSLVDCTLRESLQSILPVMFTNYIVPLCKASLAHEGQDLEVTSTGALYETPKSRTTNVHQSVLMPNSLKFNNTSTESPKECKLSLPSVEDMNEIEQTDSGLNPVNKVLDYLFDSDLDQCQLVVWFTDWQLTRGQISCLKPKELISSCVIDCIAYVCWVGSKYISKEPNHWTLPAQFGVCTFFYTCK